MKHFIIAAVACSLMLGNVYGMEEFARNSLFSDIRNSNIPQVQKILKMYPKLVHAQEGSGFRPLHVAAMRGHVDMANLLIEFGASVDALDVKYGRTPLHYAARAGNSAKTVELLISHGANVNAIDFLGHSPLDYALICRHNEAFVSSKCDAPAIIIIKLLRTAGAQEAVTKAHL